MGYANIMYCLYLSLSNNDLHEKLYTNSTIIFDKQSDYFYQI